MRFLSALTLLVLVGNLASITPASAFDGRLAGDCSVPGSAGILFNLRQDFSDLIGLSCPSSASTVHAIGASASYTRDLLANKDSAAINGLATLAVEYHPPREIQWLQGLDVGPFVQGTRLFPINQPGASVTDTVTTGGFAAMTIASDHLDSFVRLRGGEVTGNQGITSSTMVFEWEPHLLTAQSLYFGSIITNSIGYTIDPELLVQYDQLRYGPRHYLIFSTSVDSLRVGTQFVLRLFAIGESLNDPVSKSLVFGLTYHA